MEKTFMEIVCLQTADGFEFGKIYALTGNDTMYVVNQNGAIRVRVDKLSDVKTFVSEGGAIFAEWIKYQPIWDLMIAGFSGAAQS